METVHDLAKSGGNTPTQLLALQRLADFPARAEIREERRQLDHKKFAHKCEMDTFRKETTATRLDLAKQSFTFRQQQHQDRLTLTREKLRSAANNQSAIRNPRSEMCDSLGPIATNWDEVGERARLHFDVPKEEWARRQALHDSQALHKEFDENGDHKTPPQAPCLGGPHPVSPDSTDGGAKVLSSPECTPAMSNAQCPINNAQCISVVNPSTVDAYTIQRAHEYWAWRRLAASLPDGQSPPPFITEYRHCPCGKPNPCPDHANETYGEFPAFFWSTSPHLHLYELCLTAHNLPYRDPCECVPAEFRIYTRPSRR